MKNPFKIAAKEYVEAVLPVPQEVTPDTILDNFVSKLQIERDSHLCEIDRLEAEIDLANRKLANHRKAYEACNTALMPLCNPANGIYDPRKDRTSFIVKAGEFNAADVPPPSFLKRAMNNVEAVEDKDFEQSLMEGLELNVWPNDSTETNGKSVSGSDSNTGKASGRTNESR